MRAYRAVKVHFTYLICNIYPFFFKDTIEMLLSSSSILRRYVICTFKASELALLSSPQMVLRICSRSIIVYFSVTMEPHCALKVAKHLCKNKDIIIITLMADLG